MPDVDLGGVLSAATEYGDQREQAGRDSRDEEVEALENSLLLATEQVERLSSDYDALKAEFDAYKASHPDAPAPDPEPDPEPEPDVHLFGTSYGGADESKNHGRAEVARIFFQGNVPADPFADADYKQAYADGARHFVFSWKGTQTGAQVKAAFSKIPAGVTVYGCYWHEPEDNIPGTLSLSAWQSRHKEHAAALREVGVIPVTILMQYTLTDRSGRDVSDYYVGDDGFMFDAYFNPAKGKDNPEQVVDRIVEAAKAAGAKFAGLGETGTPKTVAEATTYDLVKRLRAKILATPMMRVNCYWPSGDFVFPSQRVADVWFEG